MKRYRLHLHGDSYSEPIAILSALHEGKQKIVLTYYNLIDSKTFTQNLLEKCQTLQRYDLHEDSKNHKQNTLNNYMLMGINDVARMLYFVPQGDSEWLEERKLELIQPKNFFLNWDKQGGFEAEWS